MIAGRPNLRRSGAPAGVRIPPNSPVPRIPQNSARRPPQAVGYDEPMADTNKVLTQGGFLFPLAAQSALDIFR